MWSAFVSLVMFFFFFLFIKSDLSSAAPEEEQNQKEKAGNKSEVQQCKLCVCVCSGAANQRFPTAGTKPAASSSCMTAPQWPPTPLLHLNSSSSSSSPRRSYSSPAVTVCPRSLSLQRRDQDEPWLSLKRHKPTSVTTNSINVTTCEGPTKVSRGCGHVTWTYCHQLRRRHMSETEWTWKYKLSSRKQHELFSELLTVYWSNSNTDKHWKKKRRSREVKSLLKLETIDNFSILYLKCNNN